MPAEPSLNPWEEGEPSVASLPARVSEGSLPSTAAGADASSEAREERPVAALEPAKPPPPASLEEEIRSLRAEAVEHRRRAEALRGGYDEARAAMAAASARRAAELAGETGDAHQWLYHARTVAEAATQEQSLFRKPLVVQQVSARRQREASEEVRIGAHGSLTGVVSLSL